MGESLEVLIEILNFSLLGVTVIRCPNFMNSFAHILVRNFTVTLASIGNDMEVKWPLMELSWSHLS